MKLAKKIAIASLILIAAMVALVLAQPYIYQSAGYHRTNNPVAPTTGTVLNSPAGPDGGSPTSGNWITTSVPNDSAWYCMLNVTFNKADQGAHVSWQLYEWNGAAYAATQDSPVLTTFDASAGINYVFATAAGGQSGNPDWSAVASVNGDYVVVATVTP